MEYKLDYIKMPQSDEHLTMKSVQLGNDFLTYWVTRKNNDNNYEKINSEFSSGLSAILNLNKDNENLKQALMSSQKAVFTANNQMQNMQQVILKMQKQQFMQQQNNGGNDNVSK